MASYDEIIKNRMDSVSGLDCNSCGKRIGYAYEFDFNDSAFFCDECYEKHKAAANV